jgi:hypothetical protein
MTTIATVAEICDNSTGVVREYAIDGLTEADGVTPSDWMWEGGNYSCDCNRRLFFARAAGEDEDWYGGCGDVAYSVRVREAKTGRVFYNEFDLGSK